MSRNFREPSDGKYWLYVLECEDGYYYIGTTKNVTSRYHQHRKGEGAKFTKKHKPIRIYTRKLLGDMSYKKAEEYEDYCTMLWKNSLGMSKVSGGRFVKESIRREQVKKEIAKIDVGIVKKLPLPKVKEKNTKKIYDKNGKLCAVIKSKKGRKVLGEPMVDYDSIDHSKYDRGFKRPRAGKKTGTDPSKNRITRV